MKIRAIVLSCLACVIVLFMGHEYSQAEPKDKKSSLKIGVVSVRETFRDCKSRKEHDKELRDEESRANAVLNKLNKDIEAAEAGLETLRRESSDYLELERDVVQKRASYQSQKAFYEKQLGLKDRLWTKSFYKEFLRVTSEVAEEKDFDLVFERSEPDLSMVSAAGLLMTMQTHKLLYSDGCIDITEEVMARLDKEGSKVKNEK